MKKTILTGFSLIEILVSLIIISLITAAFVPVITKKLSISSMVLNGSISGGSSGNNSGGNHTGNNTLPSLIKSQEDCDKIANSLIFLSQEQNGGKAACVTKANVGDTYRYGPEISSATGVTIVNSGASCGSGDNSKCCWLGNNGESTSNYCEDNGNGDSTYSGCKRTVCTWAAAKSVCENWEPVEGTKGKWRLPKNEELAAWGRSISAINRNQGFAGLQLCDRYSGYGSVQCMGYKACLGTTDGMCNPLYVWSGTEASSNQARYYYLQSGNFSADYDSINRAFSARCVLDEDSWKETTGATEPKDPDQEIPDSNKPFYGSLPTDITSQSDCDKLARNLYFISAENNGGVAACVTKANVGDTYMYGPEISVAADVSVVNAGNICGSNSHDDKCCWLGNNIGQTSGDGCNDNNGGYSGCKRTVCTLNAAIEICKNWAPTDETKGYWRLPRLDEFEAWKKNLNNISNGKGTNGLQLCQNSNSSNYATCNPKELTITANPNTLWGSTYTSQKYSSNSLINETVNKMNYSNAASARCMIDATTIQNINKKLNNNFTLPDGINSQNDCDKMGVNLLFIKASENRQDAACVTKANMGDTYAFGYAIPTSSGVTVVQAGKSCTSGKCCWQGKTASPEYANNLKKNSNYTGEERTVCDYNAGVSICENFEPVAKTKGRWRLPEHEEMMAWGTNNILNLQICADNDTYYGFEDSNYKVATCGGYSNCTNSKNSVCYPGYIWKKHGTWKYSFHAYVYQNNYNSTQYSEDLKDTDPASIRCIITDSTIRAVNNVDNLPSTISSQADCNELGKNLMYLTAEQNGGIAACVTKANAGDTYMNGPAIDSSTKLVSLDDSDNRCSSYSSCCVYGNNIVLTASGTQCGVTGNGNSTYSGCKRTLCNYQGATDACKKWESVAGTKGYWRLPTKAEATVWVNKLDEIQLNKGSNGLQLCDEYPNYGSVECYYRYHYNNYGVSVDPYEVWTSDTWSSGAYFLSLYNGEGHIGGMVIDRDALLSTRCVLDQTALTKLKNWEVP